MMPGKMDCYGLTDIGKVREVNEDQFLIADLNKSMLIHQTSLSHEDHTRLFGGSQGQLLLVADGLGGHAAGKQASTLAVHSQANSPLSSRAHERTYVNSVSLPNGSAEPGRNRLRVNFVFSPGRRGNPASHKVG